MTTFEQFRALPLDKSLLALEEGDPGIRYFCYPEGAAAIGYEGTILYCFLEGYGGTVFAYNPESCGDAYVYPLAADFSDFLRLILACGSANPVEQTSWMNREQFAAHLAEEAALRTPEQQAALDLIAETFSLTPMEDPFAYCKALQAGFDGSRIVYTDEYYDALGIQRN